MEGKYDHSAHYLKDPSFSYMPMQELASSDDFSGAAHIFYDGKRADIDLIVHGVDFTFTENAQVTEHIGDTYETVFFGKAPLEVTIEATLPDSLENFGKTNLLNAYKNLYRATAVSRLKKMPVVVCKDIRFTGPFVKLVISEESESCDTCSVVITMLAMAIDAPGDEKLGNLHISYGDATDGYANVLELKDKAYQHSSGGKGGVSAFVQGKKGNEKRIDGEANKDKPV